MQDLYQNDVFFKTSGIILPVLEIFTMKRTLNICYGAVSALYWMSFAAIIPFASAFLLEKEYSNSEIGTLLSLSSLLATVMQPFLADISDKSKRFSCIEVVLALLAFIFLFNGSLLFSSQRSLVLALTFGLVYASVTALQPLVNSICYKLEECDHHINFGLCRGIGSISYAAIAAVLGMFVERIGEIVITETEQFIIILFLLALYITRRLFIKAISSKHDFVTKKMEPERINLPDFIRQNKLFLLLNVGVIFLYLHNCILNTYMLQIAVNVGGTPKDMGFIMAMKASLELIPMALLDIFLKKFSSSTLAKFGVIGFIIKIGLILLANNVAMLYVGNAMQMISLSFFLPSMVVYIGEIMKEGEAVKGQAFFIACTSISGVFANAIGGVFLDNYGAKTMLTFAFITCIIGALIIFYSFSKLKKFV